MRIGLVIYGSLDTVSGGYLYDRIVVQHLQGHGEDVRIISIPPSGYFKHLIDNATVRLPLDVDIIIEDELVHPSVLAANIRRARSIPVVSLVHNLHSSERRAAWQNAIYRQAERPHLTSVDGYIFNSTVTQASVAALAGNSKPHLLASPAGDRLGSLRREQVLERVSIPGPLRLLFLANVTPLKGLHVVLSALAGLPGRDLTLDVAGSLGVSAAYAERMQRQARLLETPVRFHGALEDDPLRELLSQSDVLVLPSFYEGFGIAYLEGMAFGLPAIGTTAGAIPLMIQDGVNGYMIAPGDSAALAGLIGQLRSDRQLLMQLSLGALDYFASRPTWDQSAEAIRLFLRQMLDRHNSYESGYGHQ